MKSAYKILTLVTLVAMLAMTPMAGADQLSTHSQQIAFNQYSGFASTIRYSAPIRTGTSTKRTVQLFGYTNSTQAAAGIGGVMSGTAAAYCGSSLTGPWTPCKDALGNAVTTTATATFELDNQAEYIMFGWTRGAVSSAYGLTATVLYGGYLLNAN